MELLQIMKRVELFRGLNESQLNRISEISRPKTYAKGEVICNQGEAGDEMFIISAGEIEIIVRDGKGHTYSAVYLGTGQVVGEMSLIDQGARSATAKAAQDETLVYSIPADDFTSLCKQDTGIGYLMMRNLAQDLSFKLRHHDFNPSDT